jgi:hypothetical protein
MPVFAVSAKPLIIPEGTPSPYIHPDQHSWLLQTTLETQKSITQLAERVDALRGNVKEHGSTLQHIQRVMYAAYAVGVVLIIVGGFLLNKAWGPIMNALELQ